MSSKKFLFDWSEQRTKNKEVSFGSNLDFIYLILPVQRTN